MTNLFDAQFLMQCNGLKSLIRKNKQGVVQAASLFLREEVQPDQWAIR